MVEVFEELAGVDRLIHEPARLAIMTALSSVESADFLFLGRLTGLTAGNLSAHLAKLEAAGFVKTEKRFVARRPNTTVEITGSGKTAIEAHWEQLESLRERSQNWRPE